MGGIARGPFARAVATDLALCAAALWLVALLMSLLLDGLPPAPPEPTTSSSSTTTFDTTSSSSSCDAPSWAYAPILTETAYHLSAALDSGGTPFLAWGELSGYVVTAFYDGAAWATELPTNRSDYIGANSISAANVDGLPAVAYGSDFVADHLVFAQRDGSGAWNVTDLEPGGVYASAAAGPDGQPRVAHVANNSVIRLVARNSSLAWSGETVYASPQFITACALAYGAGLPAIAAVETDASTIQRVALHLYDGASWSANEIENVTAAGSNYQQIAPIYAGGSWSVAYEIVNSTESVLKYATLAGSWTIETIANSSAHFLYPSASLACTGAVRLAFFYKPSGSPPVAVVASGSNGSWVEEFSHAYPSSGYLSTGAAQVVASDSTATFWAVQHATNSTVSEAVAPGA
jgi:hypothetical protein